MTKNYATALLIFLLFFTASISAQIVNIPDANFKAALLAHSQVINTNGDSEIQVSEAQGFTGALWVSGKSISDLAGIEAFTSITMLFCHSNQLTSLNLTANTALTYLKCDFNQLSTLDLTANTALTTLICTKNQLTTLIANTALTALYCDHNLLTSSSLNLNTNIALTFLDCSYNLLTSLNLETSTDLSSLVCTNNQLSSLDITTNTALKTLYCNYNQLTELDLSSNTVLNDLQCFGNQLTSLDLSTNTVLKGLACYNNQLTSLDLKVNKLLRRLHSNNNQLTSLELTTNTELLILECAGNQITSLNLRTNTKLTRLLCSNNQITSLNLTANTDLTYLGCNDNKISSLNLRANRFLTSLFCYSNQLTTLDLRNGNNTSISSVYMRLFSNPNLTCISVDDPVWSLANWTSKDVQTKFSSDCACGIFSVDYADINYLLCDKPGKIRIDISGTDAPFQYKWLGQIAQTDSIISPDTAGIYVLKVTNALGCESVLSYILKAPKSIDAFELNTNLSAGNFRPGLITCLNLSAWNDGCKERSGLITVTYHGPVTFESASLPPNSHVVNKKELKWSFSQMKYADSAFLSKICFQVDSNAQIGDRICFDVEITPRADDMDSTNNDKSYCYDVVNSYDPNDKQVYPQGVCAENYTLKDQPLTYTLRFQNTGNAPAIDVFLIDSLSPYLDINTLRVLTTSHQPMVTEVLTNNNLKFDFKNINLADSLSDEEASKGFVVYEIRPYPGLNENTVIENSAGIYFDFNPPVITNTTRNTLVSVLPQIITSTISETVCGTYIAPNHDTYTSSGIYTAVVQNAFGCDSTITINLTVNNPSTSNITETVCNSYTAPNGQVYTTSGTYTAIIPNAISCDSIISINLTVKNPSSSSITESVCNSYTASDGQIYSTSGTYTAVIPNVTGCDSTVTINLTVNNPSTSSISESVCNSYTAPDGQVYTSSGTYTAVIPNVTGCDSTVTINLTVNNPSTSSITESVCNSYTAADGQIYTASGIYTAVIPNAISCDSIITINLTVNNPSTSNITETVCNSYSAPDGQVYTSSGTFTAIIQNTTGCDSTITINLVVNLPSNATFTESVCQQFIAADGQIFTTSGNYVVTIPNSLGCDSIINYELTINKVDTSIAIIYPIIASNAFGAVYQWLDCQNGMSTIPGATNQYYSVPNDGIFAVSVSQNGCTDTSACVVMNLGKVDPLNDYSAIKLYPNPTNSLFNLDLGQAYPGVTIRITDVHGKEIKKVKSLEKQVFQIELNEAADGVYFIHVSSSDKELAVLRLVKE